nr:uncharacterized protein LOC4344973 isoform X2 [Oryza sativa Japonica Group]
MEATAAAAAAPARSALPFRSRVAAAARPGRAPALSAAPGRRLVARRAAGDGQAVEAQEALPIEKRFPPFPSVMDINQIREILPHRFPFLLVDRVIEYKGGEYAVGIKNVTINDNFFPGHFPERPIMPGVLMVEDGEIPNTMEEEKPSAGVQPDPTVPTMALSWMLPTQGQETIHDTMNTAYEMSSSETPPLRADQAAAAAPMDVEVQLRQRQPQAPPCQQAHFWSGFF